MTSSKTPVENPENGSRQYGALLRITSSPALLKLETEEMSPCECQEIKKNIVRKRIQYFDRQVSASPQWLSSNNHTGLKKTPSNNGIRPYSPSDESDRSSGDSGRYKSWNAETPEIVSQNEDEEEDQEEARVKKIYKIAKEMMTSEESYIHNLKLLNESFRNFIFADGKCGDDVIPKEEFDRILSFIPELQFLTDDLLADFRSRVKNWDHSHKIADIMVNKGKFLLIYASYIKEFPANSRLYVECFSKYPKFAELVQKFQSKEECRNLKIEHLMLEPIQRLPRYKLLFERYVKNLQPGDEDYDSAIKALEIVKETAEKANRDLQENDSFKKMLSLQTRVNESDLIQPDRELIKEGELLKISRNSVDPRYIVLLTDCILYTSSYSILSGDPSNTQLRIHYRIPLMKLKVVKPDDVDAGENDFQIISSVRSCVLRASSSEEKNEWMKVIEETAESYRTKRSTFAAAVQGGGSIDNDDKPSIILGETAPVWIPDQKVSMCQSCTVEFSVLMRRHHCRGCGIVTCSRCTENRAPLKYLKYKSDRVCDSCYDSVKEEYYYQDAKANSQYLNLFRKRGEPKSGFQRSVPSRLKMKANAEGAQASGYLKKRVVRSGKWKRLWFVLKDRVLYAYKASGDTVAVDTFPVLGFQVEIVKEKLEDLNASQGGGSEVFQLIHAGLQKYSLCFRAENDQQLQKWLKALQEASTL